MRFKERRGGIGSRAVLLAIVGAAMLALSGIGASSAFAEVEPCEGSNIAGEGASLQGKSQSVWTGGAGGKGFNGNATFGCVGGPTVSYTASGSGAGLGAWGVNSGTFNTNDKFIASDDAPNSTQLSTIDSTIEGVAGAGQEQVVIPVTQTAIAVVVNPPANCTVSRITTHEVTTIFNGTLKKWNDLMAGNFTEHVAGACNQPIKRVVRKDGSGTTYQFKHYLFVDSSAEVPCVPGLSSQTWETLQSNTKVGEVLPNTSWPEPGGGECAELTEVVRPAATGGGALVEKVNATAGSIGYAALPDAQNKKAGTTTIVELQNSNTPTYASPSAGGSQANCAEAEYGKPAGATSWEEAGEPERDWSGVYGANPTIGGTKYPLCTLTWDALTVNSSSVFGPGTGKTALEGEEVARTLKDYFGYVLSEGGQGDLAGNWYAALPAGPAEAAATGLSLVN